MADQDLHVQTIVNFLTEIGIQVRVHPIAEKTFLPGITTDEGCIVMDKEKLAYPGDLLHEAGHLAVTPQSERHLFHLKENETLGNEIAAIAWSFAALTYLRLPPEVVFHSGGYKGASDWYIENYTSGTHIGLPLLQWMGFCVDEKTAKERGMQPYPAMQRWLRK